MHMKKQRRTSLKKLVSVGLLPAFALFVVILIDQLRTDLVCTETDEFCTSGNTVGGDIVWSLVITLFLVVPLWLIGVTALRAIESHRLKNSKNS